MSSLHSIFVDEPAKTWLLPINERVHNFYPGPGMLPESVVQQAMGALWNYNQSGVGLAEYSHRCEEVSSIITLAEQRIRRLTGLNDDYAVLFLQGGGSAQFCMAPMNFAKASDTIDFLDTGYWSQKAITEAKLQAKVNIAASSEQQGFRCLPSEETYRWSENPAYIHYVSNNTIYGTQFTGIPKTPQNTPVICDMSSDIFSRPLDVHKYGMIFASAHKNLGPAGVALVLVKKDLIERAPEHLPTFLKYKSHYQAGSLYNSAPMFSIYFIERVLKWLEDAGGLESVGLQNQLKANLLYEYLDQSQIFGSLVGENYNRSQMNICFEIYDKTQEEYFIRTAEAAGFRGLRGHKIVGDLRASLYNAVSLESCEKLVDFMHKFEKGL